MQQPETFTVLVPVYAGDRPGPLQEALESLWRQTIGVNDVLVVVDGPIAAPLESVIEAQTSAHAGRLRVLRLPENRGLSRALNTALPHVTRPWIVRMDADDVSVPERLATQFEFLRNHSQVDMLGSSYLQMDREMAQAGRARVLPEEHAAIRRYSRFRTPINHVTIVVRTAALKAVGGYRAEVGAVEDWWLALDFMRHGYRLHNLREPLVLVRGGTEFLTRRRGWKYARMEFRNMRAMRQARLMTGLQFLGNIVFRCAPRLFPAPVLRLVYNQVLRRRVKT